MLPAARDAESLAVLLYTSGTSGRPRAAMLSHRALLANIDQAARVEPPMVTADDVVYGLLPLFHVYGLNAVLGQTLATGATLVLVDGFSAEQSLDHVTSYGVTVLPVAPPVLAAWRSVDGLADRLAGVRTVMSGAAPLSEELLEEYAARFGVRVHQGYGLTETAPVLTSTLCGTDEAKRASVGRALPGVELRLREESTGSESRGRGVEDAGDPGVIEVRGANLFSGYWPDGSDGPDADGWWSTGDVGLLDDDGDLFLLDRVKELDHRLRLQRLPLRDRGGARRGAAGAGGGGGRRTGRVHRRGRRGLRASRRGARGRPGRSRGGGSRARRGPAGPLQAARAGRGGGRRCRAP